MSLCSDTDRGRCLLAERPPIVSPVPGMIGTNTIPLEADIPSIKEAITLADERRSSISADLARIDIAIQALVAERDAIDRFRETHTMLLSPARRIVSDVWLEIFSWAVLMDRETTLEARGSCPVLLTHVCRSWRDIASAHALWSHINIEFGESRYWAGNAQRRLGQHPCQALLNMWLSRSGVHPLSIRAGGGHPAMVDMMHALVQQSERWEDVTIDLQYFEKQDYDRLIPLIRGNIPILKRLFFRKPWTAATENLFTFQVAPELRELDASVTFDKSEVHLPRLKTVTFSCTGSVEFASLVRLPALEELKVMEDRWIPRFPQQNPQRTILQRLRKVTSEEATLLRGLRLPSLRHLELGTSDYPVPNIRGLESEVLDLCAQSHSPLIESLTIIGLDGFLSYTFLTNFTQLTSLSLHGRIHNRMLVILTVHRTGSGVHHALPSIETIELHTRILTTNHRESQFKSEDPITPSTFQAMVQSRWDLSNRTLRRVHLDTPGLRTEHVFTQWISAMREQGLDISVETTSIISLPRTPLFLGVMGLRPEKNSMSDDDDDEEDAYSLSSDGMDEERGQVRPRFRQSRSPVNFALPISRDGSLSPEFGLSMLTLKDASARPQQQQTRARRSGSESLMDEDMELAIRKGVVDRGPAGHNRSTSSREE